MCDPIWQVTLRSFEMVFHEQLYNYLYLLPLPLEAIDGIEPVGGQTIKSVTHGRCDAKATVRPTLPQSAAALDQYQIILPGDRWRTKDPKTQVRFKI